LDGLPLQLQGQNPKKPSILDTPGIQSKISGLKKKDQPSENSELELFREFPSWKKSGGTK